MLEPPPPKKKEEAEEEEEAAASAEEGDGSSPFLFSQRERSASAAAGRDLCARAVRQHRSSQPAPLSAEEGVGREEENGEFFFPLQSSSDF